MKKNVILAIIAMAILATTVAVVSCKKEKHEENKVELEQLTPTSENMDEYLKDFKKKLLSAQKGEESISLEQAERDLGNLLNFDFGDANYIPEEIVYDTLHVGLNSTDGQVDLSQLAVTYENAVNGILKAYHEIDLPYKTVYCILCDVKTSESKDGEPADVEIVLVTSRDLGSVPENEHDTLDWRPKNRAGSCDGQYVGVYGAPEIIRKWIFESLDIIACTNGGRVYYTDVASWATSGFYYYDNGLGCFRIYTSSETDQDAVCIPHDTMEYYYSQILDIYHQQPFGNHRIISFNADHSHYPHALIPAFNQVLNVYTWRITIQHGKPNCTGVPLVD